MGISQPNPFTQGSELSAQEEAGVGRPEGMEDSKEAVSPDNRRTHT